jgi:hypothetical protein
MKLAVIESALANEEMKSARLASPQERRTTFLTQRIQMATQCGGPAALDG